MRRRQPEAVRKQNERDTELGLKKACAKCADVKPFAEFYVDWSKHDGRRPWCITCEKRASSESQRRRAHEARITNVPVKPTTICQQCYDLSHRRPRKRPCACGKEYQAEVLKRGDVWGSSALGEAEVWA
jgi:hypothetical protein